jgi:hypothetical protein
MGYSFRFRCRFHSFCFHHRLPPISSAYSLHPLSALEMNSTFFVSRQLPHTVIQLFLCQFSSFQYYRTYRYPILLFPIFSYLQLSCTYLPFSNNNRVYCPFLQLPSYLIQLCTLYCHLIFII